MRKSLTFRLEKNLYSEIEEMAKSRSIALSQVLCELLEIGLRFKKHIENKKASPQEEEPKINHQHLDVGASSAIESLLLLRKITKETHPEWIEEVHVEAAERIKKLKD